MSLNVIIPMRGARLIASAWLVTAAVAGCGGDGPTDPVLTAGSISFTYSGALSGSFGVNGIVDPDADQPPAEGAGAFTDAGVTVVIGIRTLSASRVEVVEFILPTLTAPRTFQLNALEDAECSSSPAVCPFALIGLDIDIDEVNPAPSIPENLFFITDGSIVVTSVSSGRITGTFQGSASNLALDEEERVIVVTNGTFDVPVRPFEAPG